MVQVKSFAVRLETVFAELNRRQKNLERQMRDLDRQMRELAESQQRWHRTELAAREIERLHLTARLVVTFRTCTTCGELKPLDEFYLRPVTGKPQRRHRQCRDCLCQKHAHAYHARVANLRRKEPTEGLWEDDLDEEQPEE